MSNNHAAFWLIMGAIVVLAILLDAIFQDKPKPREPITAEKVGAATRRATDGFIRGWKQEGQRQRLSGKTPPSNELHSGNSR